MAIEDRLRTVFVETLELDEGFDVENLKYRDIEAWDSVGHMALVAAIEDEFDVELETEQVIDMSSFKVAVDMVTELTANPKFDPHMHYGIYQRIGLLLGAVWVQLLAAAVLIRLEERRRRASSPAWASAAPPTWSAARPTQPSA